MDSLAKPVGRYAPSPTGDLHLGNLRTALFAWLHARQQSGTFLLRMEDIDAPRVVAGSADKILKDLEWLGLDWDGEVYVQSAHMQAYDSVLKSLSERDLIYPCFCSRKDIQQAASAPHGQTGVYPGTCRHLGERERTNKAALKPPALRVKVRGDQAPACGDFVVKRADNLIAYQLAVVVDDLAQGVTQVVRGADLFDSTARQQYLAKLIAPQSAGLEYYHLPLLIDEDGKRMSKRDGSKSVDEWREEGRSAPEMIAYLAHSLNLIATLKPIDARALLSECTSEKLAKVFVSL